MKRTKKFIMAIGLAAAVAAFGIGCGDTATKPSALFDRAEYTVKNGDAVTLDDTGVTYKIIGGDAAGVTLNADGTFTVGDGAKDGAQVVIAAVKDGKVISTTVCKISVEVEPPEVDFGGLSKYIIDGGRVQAYSGYGVTYSLKTPVDGIKIDSSSGRVSYTAIVEDGTPFTVVATSRGGTGEREYLAAVGDLITVVNTSELIEAGVGRDVSFTVDYGDLSGSGGVFAEQGVLGVTIGGVELESGTQYTYDATTYTVTVNRSFTEKLGIGENEVQIHTAKNAATAQINAATYIRTAQDLAAINASQQTLAGYYALVNDIDLTEYLALPQDGDRTNGDAEKNAGGWQPIGQYKDVTDGTATAMAFRGTFDGLGHKISGLWIDWTEDREPMFNADGTPQINPTTGKQDMSPKACYFNAGLFGYTTTDSVIRNLEVESAEDKKSYMCSYSGGLVGFNNGLIENCIANVTVALEPDHRVAGGLVGRNVGTVKNCISLGTVLAGSSYGALCGINEGEVIDSFAVDTLDFSALDASAQASYAGRPDIIDLCGVHNDNGVTIGNSTVYGSLEELLGNADFSVLSDEFSVVAGELPTLIKKEGR